MLAVPCNRCQQYVRCLTSLCRCQLITWLSEVLSSEVLLGLALQSVCSSMQLPQPRTIGLHMPIWQSQGCALAKTTCQLLLLSSPLRLPSACAFPATTLSVLPAVTTTILHSEHSAYPLRAPPGVPADWHQSQSCTCRDMVVAVGV